MYYQVVRQCAETLQTVEGWLDKAEQSAAVRDFDVSVLMNSRLAPDMQGFIYQVQSACDYVKGAAAWLSGQTPPQHADTEQTIDEVRSRIRRTIAFVQSVTPDQYAGASERIIKIGWAGGKSLTAEDYLTQITVPNVYFHITAAYALLRHNGVNVGKLDFLGKIRWLEDN